MKTDECLLFGGFSWKYILYRSSEFILGLFSGIANATFNGMNSTAKYLLKMADRRINEISAKIRTRKATESLFNLQKSSNSCGLDVVLSSNKLMVNFLNTMTISLASSPVEFVDGNWHNLTLKFGTSISVLVDNNQTLSNILDISMDCWSLLDDVEVTIGSSSVVEPNNLFKGCMSEVRINGVLLPFLDVSQLNGTAGIDQISAAYLDDVRLGCSGDDVCQADDCRNNATCVDIWNEFQCACLNGFKGALCEINIDDCVVNNCSNGATCLDGVASYSCRCAAGYEGSRYADLCTIPVWNFMSLI